MTKEQDLLIEWFQRVWNEYDLDAVDEMFEPETEANGLMPDMALGSGDFKDFVPMVNELIEDIDFSLVKMTQTGDWVQGLYRVKARAAHNSAPINVMGQVCVRYEGDKMVEAYNNFDFFGFFEQLGQLPEMSLALCLSGQSLS
ncbi:MAG: ester cyclase [Cognatishimia sp.]|uniref:ester cyclase n=1 Tax=Cognatishimia sp. 1_MG-2023 TaxID=3062642 RepID=UPI0026E33059|nr:nuclear transport factor 2 family protein [Cognatishimia sp. 1_MG-2023]MDO6725346.1 ester cyclase [Cognatishimia sp. 1_MG-2023]